MIATIGSDTLNPENMPETESLNDQPPIQVNWLGQAMELNLGSHRNATFWSGPASLNAELVREEVASFVNNSGGRHEISIGQLMAGDDLIAIPLTGDAARLTTILEPLIDQLVASGAIAQKITLVAAADQFEIIQQTFQPRGLNVVQHEPDKEDQKAYLASTRAGTRIYLNRHLLDCDVVLPVIIAEPRGIGPRRGFMQALWPAFSDRETIEKINQRWSTEANRIRGEIQQTLWLGGFHLAVAAVPSSSGIAGLAMANPQQMQKKLMPMTRQAWQVPGTAVEIARNFCFIPGRETTCGKVSISQLLPMLRTAWKLERAERLVFAFELGDDALEEIRQALAQPQDAERTPARDLARWMARLGGRFKVYSLTNLPEELTDAAEWIALEEPRELENLVNRAEQWLIASDADRVRIVP